MKDQNGISSQDTAAKSGKALSRLEIEAILSRSQPSRILDELRGWLDLESELIHLNEQERHVRSTLGDGTLGDLIVRKSDSLLSTLLRRAMDIIDLPTSQTGDIGAKVYVCSRISELTDDEAIRRDVANAMAREAHGNIPVPQSLQSALDAHFQREDGETATDPVSVAKSG